MKNPKFHYGEITSAISSVINFELPWPRIYKVSYLQLTPDPDKVWYSLASDAMGLISVTQMDDNTPTKRRRYGSFHKWERVRFERNLPDELVDANVGVSFPDGLFHPDNIIYVEYAAKITDNLTGGAYTDFTQDDAVV